MCGGAVSLGLPFCGRCGSVALAAYRAVVSHRFGVLWSRRYRSIGAVLLACPPSSGLPGIVLASSRRHAVGGWGIGSSSLAPLVRYGERGAWNGRCLRRWMGFSCPLDAVSSCLFSHQWASCCLLRCRVSLSSDRSRPMPYRLAWSAAWKNGGGACLLRGDVVVILPLPAACPIP